MTEQRNISTREAVRDRAAFTTDVRARVLEMREEPTRKVDASSPAQQGSNQVNRDDYATAFTNLGALDPVYDPEMLTLIFEHSNSLRQNVDAYSTNIDGFGHRFDPIFDLEDVSIDTRIKHALMSDREREAGDDGPAVADPTPEEITNTKKMIATHMRKEKTKLELFFEFCCTDASFVTLRRWTRQDLEVMGNAYWEVLRNLKGDIVQFVYVPGFTMRLLPLDMQPVSMERQVRVSELTFEKQEYVQRLRRFVQIVEGKAVFFKQFGDTRLISSTTGEAFDDIDKMKVNDPQAIPATEIIHFRVHSPRSAYGIPRWIGNLLAVIGSRQAEEVNFNYFENKSVPPLAVLISGGRMSEDSVGRVQDYIESNLKGKRNFHKILVLEAEGPSGDSNKANAARMKIDIKPLTSAQQSDALFQNYDERNIDKVGQSFRLPRMLRGDIRDFNRSTADAALTFAEVQVFEPERQEFDFIINRKLLTTMGIRFWRFVSLAPVIRDAVSMSEIIRNLANANVLTPAECRELAGDVFNRDFKKLTAAWTKQPGAFTIAGIPPEQEQAQPAEPGATGADAGEEEDDNFGPDGGTTASTRPSGEGVQARKASRLAKSITRQAKKILAIRKSLGLEEHEAWLEYLLEQNGDAAAE